MDRTGKTSKKLLLLITSSVILVVVICLTINGTFAWMKANHSKENDLRVANLEATVSETFVPGQGIELNTSYSKKVNVVNSGNTPLVVRVAIFPVVLAEESTGSGNGQIYDIQDFIVEGLDSTKWLRGADGYYYYNDIVTPGQSVAFCDSVKLQDSTGAGANMTVEVISESHAIVKADFGDADYPTNPASDPGDSDIIKYPHELAWWSDYIAPDADGYYTDLTKLDANVPVYKDLRTAIRNYNWI